MRTSILAVVPLGVFLHAQTGVLMDWTKNETAGNADWVADHQAPLPTPYPPASEMAWDGAYSTWAYTILHRTGRRIRTLPPGATIHYSTAPQDSLDLSHFEIFILPEPQNPLSSQETQAVLDFLNQGGRVILIADHNASDRDNDGWDSPHILNAAFEDSLGIHFHIRGESYNSFSSSSSTVDTNHPVISGPAGRVYSIAFHGGTVISLTGSLSSVQGVVWHPSVAVGSTTRIMVACGTYGLGRFCAMGDSSPPDDGTGDPGDNLHDNWNELDNRILLTNMIAWLLGLETGVAENPHAPTLLLGPLPASMRRIVLDRSGRRVRTVRPGQIYRVRTPEGDAWWLP